MEIRRQQASKFPTTTLSRYHCRTHFHPHRGGADHHYYHRQNCEAHNITFITWNMSNASGHPAPRSHPHDENGTKEFPIELDVEGSEIMGSLKSTADEEAPTLAHLTDFTCAICLDAPPSITDVASISGCMHTSCFDCSVEWGAGGIGQQTHQE